LRRLPSCRYEFRAAALNLKGPSAWSAASAAARTLLTVPDPPEPPALHATAAQHGAASESIAGRSAVTLLLRAPASDGGLPISRYEVSPSARYPARHGIPIGTVSPSAQCPTRQVQSKEPVASAWTPAEAEMSAAAGAIGTVLARIRNLDPGAAYCFRVRCINGVGCSVPRASPSMLGAAHVRPAAAGRPPSCDRRAHNVSTPCAWGGASACAQRAVTSLAVAWRGGQCACADNAVRHAQAAAVGFSMQSVQSWSDASEIVLTEPGSLVPLKVVH
jgi:hypothetical protein